MIPSAQRQRLPLPNHYKHRTKKPEKYLAIRNQAEDGPSTRRAAIRAYKYLHAMVRQHGPQLQKVYEASKEHATRSKGTQENVKYWAQPQELPAVPPQLTSELLHCLSTLPDPWPLAKITFFFPSNASWLSPGRSTRSVACCIEPVN